MHSRGLDADKGLQNLSKVFALVGGQGAGNIFPNSVSWLESISVFPHFFSDPDLLKKQRRFVSFEAGPSPRSRQVLARRTPGKHIYRRDFGTIQIENVAKMCDFGKVNAGD